MTKKQIYICIGAVIAWVIIATFIAVGVSSEISETAAFLGHEFTEETPKAIIQGAWIIFVGLMINAFFS